MAHGVIQPFLGSQLRGYGIDKDYGTLKKSEVVDLLVLNKDQLDDISNTREVRLVYLEGGTFA